MIQMEPKKKKKLEIIVLFSSIWFLISLPLPFIIGNPQVNETQLSFVLPIIGLMTVPFIVLAIAWTLKPELAS